MIVFGPMSITLLICAVQGLPLATLFWRAPVNQAANRWLALLIVSVAALMTPYIIGYAGFYEQWPRLSFAPLSYTLAFGPLLYLYTATLVSSRPALMWPHFVPVAVHPRLCGGVPVSAADEGLVEHSCASPDHRSRIRYRHSGQHRRLQRCSLSSLLRLPRMVGRKSHRRRGVRAELDPQFSRRAGADCGDLGGVRDRQAA